MEEEVNQVSSGYSYNQRSNKKSRSFKFPVLIIFALIWLIFFSVAGIIIQAYNIQSFLITKSIPNFFSENFRGWLLSLKDFDNSALYPNKLDFFYKVLEQWYYLFYIAGIILMFLGIIILIIRLISFIIKKEHRPSLYKISQIPPKRALVNQLSQPLYEQQVSPASSNSSPYQESYFQTLLKQKIEEQSKQRDESLINPKTSESIKRIDEWLHEGLLLLSEGNLSEAELIYNQIRREYDSREDSNKDLYSRVKDLYDQILIARQHKIS